VAPDADEILERWMADPDSPGFDRLVDALARAPLVPETEIDAAALIYRPSGSNEPHPLTAHERRVLQYLSYGLQQKQIALLNGVTRDTVGKQIISARFKLRAKTRVQAVAIALRRGLIH
jgi:DNA-binding CsgD family transcriptional regulator